MSSYLTKGLETEEGQCVSGTGMAFSIKQVAYEGHQKDHCHTGPRLIPNTDAQNRGKEAEFDTKLKGFDLQTEQAGIHKRTFYLFPPS